MEESKRRGIEEQIATPEGMQKRSKLQHLRAGKIGTSKFTVGVTKKGYGGPTTTQEEETNERQMTTPEDGQTRNELQHLRRAK